MHAAAPSFGLPSPGRFMVYNKWSACCLHPDWVPYLLGQVVACSACQSVVFLLLGRQGHLDNDRLLRCWLSLGSRWVLLIGKGFYNCWQCLWNSIPLSFSEKQRVGNLAPMSLRCFTGS